MFDRVQSFLDLFPPPENDRIFKELYTAVNNRWHKLQSHFVILLFQEHVHQGWNHYQEKKEVCEYVPQSLEYF